MKQFKIAFFDIDGTLVDNTQDQKLSLIEKTPKSAQEAIKELIAAGITPIVATGRGLSFIEEYVNELGINSYITSNGQNIVYQGKEIYRKFLTKAEIEAIIDELDKRGLPYVYETLEDRIYIPQTGVPLSNNTENLKVGKREDYLDLDITQFIIYPEDVRGFSISIPGVTSKVVAPTVINILPADVSKASAIEVILDTLNLTKQEAIAFGDEENDYEMFTAVGTSVAMGNAIESLKEQASYVTDKVMDDGIYNACKHFKLF